MALNKQSTVTVRVSEGDLLVDASRRIRAWLDSQKIQTATFATAADAGGLTFMVQFMDPLDADQFVAALKIATGVADVTVS